MNALVEKETTMWWLAGASKYRANHSGTFSPQTPVSHHQFGWNKESQAFIVRDEHGMAGSNSRSLKIPVGLAELFFVRCLEPSFAERFLNSYCPRSEEKEVLGLEGHELHVTCSAYEDGTGRYGATLPTLSLSSGRGTDSLWLFYELRQSFGGRIKKLTIEEVRDNLRLH